ncbi:MAG: hypothetical protein CTY23_11640 [Methylomonas sp.]|nr:MAG: hypothetical protein CTY23_11640 [Methylomonas sp.]
MLLLLLQIAAPLVHAHVGYDEIGSGPHLHEFESLVSLGHGDDVQMADRQHEMAMIVVIGSAIERQIADMDEPYAVLPDSHPVLRPVYRRLQRLKPDLPWPPPAIVPWQKQNPTRAPPL